MHCAGDLIKSLKKLLARKHALTEVNEDDHDAQGQSALSSQDLSDISGIISRLQLTAAEPEAIQVLLQLVGLLAPLVMDSSGYTIQAEDQV